MCFIFYKPVLRLIFRERRNLFNRRNSVSSEQTDGLAPHRMSEYRPRVAQMGENSGTTKYRNALNTVIE